MIDATFINDQLTCPICLEPANDAVETECCNNIFCHRCILRNFLKCPICCQKWVGFKPCHVVRRILGNVPAVCPNSGCTARALTRSALIDHQRLCEFRPKAAATAKASALRGSLISKIRSLNNVLPKRHTRDPQQTPLQYVEAVEGMEIIVPPCNDGLYPFANDESLHPFKYEATNNHSSRDPLHDDIGFMVSDYGKPRDLHPKQVWLTSIGGKGMEIIGAFSRRNAQPCMELTFTNKGAQPLSGFAVWLAQNRFGLYPSEPGRPRVLLLPNQSTNVVLSLNTNGHCRETGPVSNLQAQIKTSLGVFSFACSLPINVLFTEHGQMDKDTFLSSWHGIAADDSVHDSFRFENRLETCRDDICQRLTQNNVFAVACGNVDGPEFLCHSIKLTNGVWIMSQLKFLPGSPIIRLTLKSRNAEVLEAVLAAMQSILSN